MLQLLYPYTIF